MRTILSSLKKELNAQAVDQPFVGKSLICKGPLGFSFYTPKLVLRGNIARLDGYIGVGSFTPQVQNEVVPDFESAWLVNILNLPWILPFLYFNPLEADIAAKRLAPRLQEIFDMMPASARDIVPSSTLTFGKAWKENPRTWLLQRLRRPGNLLTHVHSN